MFGFVGKLFLCSILSACQIFKLGPQKKLRQPTIIVPDGTELAGPSGKKVNFGLIDEPINPTYGKTFS